MMKIAIENLWTWHSQNIPVLFFKETMNKLGDSFGSGVNKCHSLSDYQKEHDPILKTSHLK